MSANAFRSFEREGVFRPTVFIEAPRLGERLGVKLLLASETFQHTGSFKFRAAYHLAASVPESFILAASSGNFGQALACACARLGKRCLVVMPHDSAAAKVEAVRAYGGAVELTDTSKVSRQERVEQLAREHPHARVASAYDDPLVIAGNATLGRELAARADDFDLVVAPIGGGGLTAGLITGLRAAGRATPVIAAEPLLANDAARSLRAGRIVANDHEPPTLADGARVLCVGRHNWAVLQPSLAGIVEVSEAHIAEGVRLLFTLANLKAEPTGALSLGALLAEPERFRGRSVCCVVSGGNVDAATFRALLQG
jgi:threonine dehydratase